MSPPRAKEKPPRASTVVVAPETYALLLRIHNHTGRTLEAILHVALRVYAAYALPPADPAKAEPTARGGQPTTLPVKSTLAHMKKRTQRRTRNAKTKR